MSVFDPDPTIFAYERGAPVTLISGSTTTVLQVGTAKPLGANAVGVVADNAHADQPANCMVQINIGGTGAFSALTVNLLGSLDLVNFYILATFTTAGGSINPVFGAAQARYLSASVTVATVGSGAPTATVLLEL